MPHVTELDLPLSAYAIPAFIFGLIIGSFLNVVIHRVPRGMSVVSPGSHCPSCDAPVRAFDNIPLLSYALLGGRCRACRARIPLTYPMVELLTGLMFAALTLKTGLSWVVLIEFVFASVMIALVFIDTRHHLLPNVITYPALVFMLVAATARAGWSDQTPWTFEITFIFPDLQASFTPWRAALFGGLIFALAAPGFWLLDRLDMLLFSRYFDWEESDQQSASDAAEIEKEMEIERRHNRAIHATMILGVIIAATWAALVISFSAKNPQTYERAYDGLLRASAGALIGGGFIWFIRALYFLIRGFEGMGLGDVKMISVIGAFLSWHWALGVLLLASIIGSVAGVIFILRSKKGLKTPLPFGACLGIASLIGMLTATPFSTWRIAL
jgi:prepilin signal peptidase PulO-like enzyme (type II secretory pathway)